MSRNRSFFHGTNEHWAADIVNHGQRANMSPLGNWGRGLYLTPDREEAGMFASGKFSDPAVVEGSLHPDARVYDVTDEDSERLFDATTSALKRKDGSSRRAINHWTSGFARQGYHVLRSPQTGFHVAIRPGAFMPQRVHYRDGSVNLR